MPDRKMLAHAALLDLRIQIHYERVLFEYNKLLTTLIDVYGDEVVHALEIQQVLRFVEHRIKCVDLLSGGGY